MQARFFTVKYTMVSLYFDWLLFSITWSIWKYKKVHVFIDCKWSLFLLVRRAWCERKLREKKHGRVTLGDEKRALLIRLLLIQFVLFTVSIDELNERGSGLLVV